MKWQWQGDTCVGVQGDLDRDTVPALWRDRQAILAVEQSLSVDLRDLGRADSAGMALLVEIVAQRRKRGLETRLEHVPSQLQQLMQISDIDPLMPMAAEKSQD